MAARDRRPIRVGPVLSLNLGSEVPLEHLAGAGGHRIPVKPIRNLRHPRAET